MTEPHDRDIRIASCVETDRRLDAIYALIRIVEPDPEYQEPFVTDEADLLDAVGSSAEEIQALLDAHFGEHIAVPIRLPLWQFVDALEALKPGWAR